MKFKLLLIVIILIPIFSNSQSVKVGQGSYGGSNVYGPMYTTSLYDTSYSIHAYIYNSSVLTGLENGDTISSLSFYSIADNSAVGFMNLKIYLKMTDSDTFYASNLNWTNEKNSSGMVLVYDNNPATLLNGVSEYKTFFFNNNKFRFDTSGGKKNLEILFSYFQYSKQNSNTYWVYESSFTVPEFKSRNEGKYNFGIGKAPDTTRFSDTRKPHVIINFPRYANNLEVLKTYSLGRVPLLANINDSIKILIGNRGKNNVKNAKLFLRINGANKHEDTLNIDSIAPWNDKIYSFAKYKPDSTGEENLLIELQHDDYDSNNFDSIKRIINYNTYSHADPYIGNAGGIGFNGATGDFVAKFYTDTGNYINQVTVDFSMSGRGFRFGIWDENSTNGMPGKVIFMSDSLTSKAGSYILPIIPKVKVGKSFFVGIRQNTTTNVAFAYQEEDPVRPGAFYFTEPMGNTVWTPFSPGFPYKFNIQPRIQADNDVAPIEILFPQLNQVIDYSVRDSIGPAIKITNYGVNDQNTPFEVECKIDNIYGINEYKSVKKITLKSGETKTIYFDTLFRLYNIGDHRITVTSKLKNDKIIDNDIITHIFKVAVKHDIACDIMYSPAENSIFEYNLDTIMPTVRINNIGTVAKNNFKIFFRIKNDTSVVYYEALVKSLLAGKQDIITFKTYVPKVIGSYTAECYISIKDSIPYNDTVRHKVEFIKSNDVSPLSIDVPLSTNVYAMGAIMLPRVTIMNYGSKTQLIPFKTKISIFDPTEKLVYEDTLSTQLGGYSQTQLSYKKLVIPNVYGKYKISASTLLINDQEKSNDSIISVFTVLPNRDFALKNILVPSNDTVISIESMPFVPNIKIKNEGSQTISNPGFFLFEIFNKTNKIYEDSVKATGNISYNTSLNLNFKKNVFINETGIYTCRVINKLSGDINSSNDTLFSKFRITRNFDLAIDTIGNISNGQVFNYENSFLKPQILIKNYGSKTYPDTFYTLLNLYNNGNLIKSFTKTFDSIAQFESYSWLQDSFISKRQTGDYIFKVKIIASLDQNNSNDSFAWNFTIIKPYDLSLDSITFPDKYNYCYNDKIYRPKLKISNKGLVPIVNTSINFRVYQTTNIIWQQSKDIDLGKDESKWIVFDSTLKFDFTGRAWARAIGYLTADNEKNNDTLILSFNVDFTSEINKIKLLRNYKIYPNPSEGIINFEFDDNENSIFIYDSKMKLIYNKNFIKTSLFSLDLQNEIKLSKGFYFIRVKNLKGNFISKQIIF